MSFVKGIVGAGTVVESVMDGAPVPALTGEVAVDDVACGAPCTPVATVAASTTAARSRFILQLVMSTSSLL